MVVQVLGAPTEEVQKVSGLGLPLVELNPPEGYFLFWNASRWVVGNLSLGPRFAIDFDQDGPYLAWQRQRLNPKKDLLGRALGLGQTGPQEVLDATLGLGTDALHLLALGCRVQSWERHPVLAFLMAEAVAKSQQGLSERWVIHQGDARAAMEQDFAVAYLDPMFEGVEKKSQPKKEISFLRYLVSAEDGLQLVEAALRSSIKRLVVKRPRSGDYLVQKPNNQFFGKLIRYDVYQR